MYIYLDLHNDSGASFWFHKHGERRGGVLPSVKLLWSMQRHSQLQTNSLCLTKTIYCRLTWSEKVAQLTSCLVAWPVNWGNSAGIRCNPSCRSGKVRMRYTDNKRTADRKVLGRLMQGWYWTTLLTNLLSNDVRVEFSGGTTASAKHSGGGLEECAKERWDLRSCANCRFVAQNYKVSYKKVLVES